MSKSAEDVTTRRAVLCAAVAAVAVPALAVAVKASTGEALVAEVRASALRFHASICAEAIAEDKFGEQSPQHVAAHAVFVAADRQFADLTERVFAMPARSFSDIVARAEIAAIWSNRDYHTGEIMHLEPEPHAGCDARAVAQLLHAILEMSGGDVVGPERHRIERGLR